MDAGWSGAASLGSPGWSWRADSEVTVEHVSWSDPFWTPLALWGAVTIGALSTLFILALCKAASRPTPNPTAYVPTEWRTPPLDPLRCAERMRVVGRPHPHRALIEQQISLILARESAETL